MARLELLHNALTRSDGSQRFFDEYEPGDALTRVYWLELPDAPEHVMLERAYFIANVAHELGFGATRAEADQANGYREAGLRSLSVGDVVVVHDDAGARAHAVARFGFAPLDEVPDAAGGGA